MGGFAGMGGADKAKSAPAKSFDRDKRKNKNKMAAKARKEQRSALPTEGNTAYRLDRTGIQTVRAYPPTNQAAADAMSGRGSSNRRGR